VAVARSESGLTQDQLAAAIGIPRTALTKIENGTRRVAVLELVKIAGELRRRVEWFVDSGPQAIVSYRAAGSGLATQAIDTELDRLVRDVEFVASETVRLLSGQPDEQPSPATMSEADNLATTARELLGLEPDRPVGDLVPLVANIGLLPFSLSLGDGADAGTVLLAHGGVSIINGDRRVGRRRLALAHELGHYLIADPYTTDWRVASLEAEALEARLDRFARALLMPEADLRDRWAQLISAPDEMMRDAAIRGGSYYRVDMATLARRLNELDLVDVRQANEIRRFQTTKVDIIEKDLVVSHELAPVSLPRTYAQAVLKLYRNEIITGSRAVGLLLGALEEESLPDRPTVPDAEIWAVVS
jgi:Zn-dependent peptidase ImmA (M78 family)/DNA-binding XRE family transcriptional regulator